VRRSLRRARRGVANWTGGDKDGFGTSTAAGRAWFTLAGGELSEVYAPDLGTPSLRDLQFVVSDGATFTERETDDAVHRTGLADPRSLTYRPGVADLRRRARGV
jgi:glucoamylase